MRAIRPDASGGVSSSVGASHLPCRRARQLLGYRSAPQFDRALLEWHFDDRARDFRFGGPGPHGCEESVTKHVVMVAVRQRKQLMGHLAHASGRRVTKGEHHLLVLSGSDILVAVVELLVQLFARAES